MNNSIRKRVFPESNYRSIFFNGKTLRMPIDPKKPVTELRFPEFYDVAFNTKCVTGQTMLKQRDGTKQNCYYCYASASKNGEYFTNIVDKINNFFGRMNANQTSYQVAIGGSGEALEHPDFWKACETFNKLGVVPNYTTNGMLVNEEVVEKTKSICGGVAITAHAHMDFFWRRAVRKFKNSGARLNLHVIISDKSSVDSFEKLYDEFKDQIEYFVLLPYMNVGLAAKYPKRIDYEALERVVDNIHHEGKLAFGANFYNWLLKTKNKYNTDLYPPEIFSKYLVLKDDVPTIYNNSFETKPVPFTHENGCELGHARTDFDIDKMNEVSTV